MTSNPPSRVPDSIRKVATALAPATVRAIEPGDSGANSRIFRVDTPAGPFALKSYPTRPGDPRNRAEIEWKALTFLRSHGVATVPTAHARETAGPFILMEWIEGTRLSASSGEAVANAADFAARIFALSSAPDADGFPFASEACLSARSIIDQIEQRLVLFAPEPSLDRFLSDTVRPLVAAAKHRLGIDRRAGLELPRSLQRLIPADFGFHNVLQQADGVLRYIDFEYFGWDDPVKLTADFLLHPAMMLGADDRESFRRAMISARADDPDFAARLDRHLPLFALRWALIVLNPFRSDRAAELPQQSARQALLDDRLKKAKALLDSVSIGGRQA